MGNTKSGPKKVSLIPAQLDIFAANSVESVTDGPLWLFLRDTWTFFTMLRFFPKMFLPFWTDEPSDEFYLKSRNFFGLLVLTLGSVLEVILIALAIPMTLICPIPGIFSIFILAGSTALVHLIFLSVQGNLIAWSNDPKDPAALALQQSHDTTERWMFLNGCCVTGHMLQQNLNLISKTFGRKVFAIHNRTYGLVGDVAECIIQRSFRFYSEETRTAYLHVKSYCLDPAVLKVVLIGHSQGGIMASEILDQLYQDLPSECIAKLEVYTFGNAAMHFNNPLRKLGPVAASSFSGPPSPISIFSPMTSVNGKATENGLVETPISDIAPLGPLSLPAVPEPLRVIPYIEHYCNSNDMVTRWGVLHSVKDIVNNRFCGQVFVSEDTDGHMLNQHYLSKMFPIVPAQAELNGNTKTNDKASNVVPFLDRFVEVDTATPEKHLQETKKQLGVLRANSLQSDPNVDPASPTGMERVAAAKRQATVELEMGDTEIIHLRNLAGATGARLSVVKPRQQPNGQTNGKTLRQLSRLWMYMGGESPKQA